MSAETFESTTSRPDPIKPIRVLIVDDHAVVRQGLRTFLELQDDPSAARIEVVGQSSTGVEAVALALDLQPDVVLLDLVMPEWMGIRRRCRSRISAHRVEWSP